eukprot:3546579-Amphidinium_carterae.1
MKQSSGFEAWRQLTLRGGHHAQQFSLLRTIMQPCWGPRQSNAIDSTTSGWKTLACMSQRMDKGQSQITSRLPKSSTISKPERRLSQRTNSTSLDHLPRHKWWTWDKRALVDNETEDYTDEYNEQYVIAFNNWYRGKGNKRQWNSKGKGKGKNKGGKTETMTAINPKGAVKDKGQQPVVWTHFTTMLAKEMHTTTTTTAKDNSNRAGKQYNNYYNKQAGKKSGVYNIQETTDYGYYGYYDDSGQQQYWPKVDYSQLQQPVEAKTSPQQQHSHNNQQRGCSTRLMQSTTSTSTDKHQDNSKTFRQ